MGKHWTVEIEPPKALHEALELDLLEQAVARSPDQSSLVTELARRLMIADRFTAVIDLLEPRAESRSDLVKCSLLAQAYMSCETTDATRRALDLAQRGLELADDPRGRGYMLAEIGKALTRLGRFDEALATLEAAITVNPQDRNAYKRIVAHHLREGNPAAILELADRLNAQDIGHARLFASRVLAHASLGDYAAAREAEGLDTFLHSAVIDAPPGWTDIASFNAALAGQLLGHPALRYDRYGTASTRTWRIDRPAMHHAPLVGVLQQEIARHVEAFVASHEGAAHPWFKTRPPQGMLHNWCVITEADGLEEWHVHQNGWLSGSYYVSVPGAVSAGSDEAGCLAYGLPEDLAGAEVAAGFGQRLLRPQPGLLAMFPSHCYHRTYQHGTAERRICLAFDILPN
jgi:uncharacterized protein (TIGR02466 family)